MKIEVAYSSILKTILGLAALLVFLFSACCIYLIFSTSKYNLKAFENLYLKTQNNIQQNEIVFNKIFLDLFDNAKKCSSNACRKAISDEIHSTLKKRNGGYPMYEATYFVRLNKSQNLEKLFLNGQWKEEIIDTQREKKVLRYLLNNNNKEYMKGLFIMYFPKNMIFLDDLYSEGEIIIPVKNEGQIVGAVVKLYGQ